MYFYSETIEEQQQVELTPVNPGAVFLYLNNSPEPILLRAENGDVLEFYI